MPYLLNIHRVILLSLNILFFIPSIFLCQGQNISLGADELLKSNMELLQNKNIGIITNQTGKMTNGQSVIDSLLHINNVKISAIFAPEHGFLINTINGEFIADSEYKNIKIHSLYGNKKKITSNDLKNIDLLIFDIQDIGARFYTYISTLYYALYAAAEFNTDIIVLDRPNPLGGNYVDGPMLKPEFKSFIGIAPLPVVHGMTVGELSLYFNDLILKKTNTRANLSVIKMQNWHRERSISYFQHNWTSPSPNITNFETALIYPGTCLLEGTNASEGRGTDTPFLLIGAPYIEGKDLIKELKLHETYSLSFSDTIFTPKSIIGKTTHPKYENETCGGIKIRIVDKINFEPVKFGIKLLYAINKLYPNDFKFNNDWIDKLVGASNVRQMILSDKSSKEIIDSWQNGVVKFKKLRKKYLIY